MGSQIRPHRCRARQVHAVIASFRRVPRGARRCVRRYHSLSAGTGPPAPWLRCSANPGGWCGAARSTAGPPGEGRPEPLDIGLLASRTDRRSHRIDALDKHFKDPATFQTLVFEQWQRPYLPFSCSNRVASLTTSVRLRQHERCRRGIGSRGPERARRGDGRLDRKIVRCSSE